MAGDVWIARAAGGTLVAVKIVRSLSKLGGRKEFQALKTLRNIRHPNLCPVHGFWTKDANGQLLRDGETQANLPESSVFDKVKPKGSVEETEPMLSGTMTFDSVSKVTPEEPKPKVTYPKAEELIVVMGLGDCTLHDRLMEVRDAAGIPKKSTEEVCGLPADEVIEYLRAASKAIDELNHKHNIYHCDIKPQNILKVGGGIQVCDFGLANRIEQDVRETRQAFASVAYGAPEVLNDSTYSRSVDQYSLAITYYELRTGVLPFDATTFAKVVLAKSAEEFDMRHVSNAEQKVLKKATRKDPKERYESCSEFIAELAIASGVDKRSGITAKRAAIAAMLALVLIGGLVYNLVNQGDAAAYIEAAEISFDQVQIHPGQICSFNDASNIATGIRNILQAQSASPTSTEADVIQQHAGTWGQNLSDTILNELEETSTKETNKLEKCASYIHRLDALVAPDDSILDPKQPPGSELRDSIALARVQIDLLLRSHQPTSTSETAIALAPEKIAKAIDHLRGLRQSNDLSRSLTAAVTVAVTHDWADLESKNYQDRDALQDVGQAEKIFVQRQASLPVWIEKRWTQSRDDFVTEANRQIKADQVGPELKRTLAEYFPNIAIDALVLDLEQGIAANDWAKVANKTAELGIFLEQNKDLQSKYGRAAEMFRLMNQAIERPSNAAGLIRQLGMHRLREGESVAGTKDLNSEYGESIATWMTEIVERLLQLPEQLSFETAKSIYSDGVLFIGNTSLPALDRLLMVAAMRDGPTSLNDKALEQPLRTVRAQEDELHSLLRSAIQIERDPANSDRRTRDLVFSASGREKLTALVSAEFVDYLDFLAHSSSGWDDSEIWKIFQANDPRAVAIRDAIGLDRQRRVSEAFLATATKESGVGDDDVVQLRFASSDAGKALVQNAQWWMENSADKTTNLPLKTQELLLEIARFRSDGKPLHQIIRLEDLAKYFPEDTTNADLGQFYRAAFEILLSGIQSEGAAESSMRVPLLIQTTNRMCKMLPKNPGLYDAWRANVMDPVMSIVRQQHEGLDDNDQLFEFMDQYLKTLDETVGLTAESMAQLANLEMASARLAMSPRLSNAPDRRIRLWLQASESLQRSVQLSQTGWSRANLQKLAQYVSAAEAITNDVPEVAVHRAFGRYYQARETRDRGKLADAESQLKIAIEKLEGSATPDQSQIPLYTAYWRHANALVSLAYAEKNIKRKSEMLTSARQSALKATNMLSDEKLANRVYKNHAYMVLGNACEDLAEYCSDGQDQRSYFNEAIRAFQNAVSATKFENSIEPKYSLARCRFRFWESLPDRQRNLKQIEMAKQDLGELSEESTAVSQMKWLAWSSRIHEGLGNRTDALQEIQRAYQLVLDRSAEIPEEDRAEPIRLYAVMLSNNGNEKEKREALRIVDQIESPEWSLIELKCKLLSEFNEADRLLRFVNSISEKRMSEFREDPDRISEHLCLIAYKVQYAASKANRKLAGDCLKSLLSRSVEKHGAEGKLSAKANAYLQIIRAHGTSLNDRETASNRIRRYLSALRDSQATTDLEPVVVAEAQFALYEQFKLALDSLDSVFSELSSKERAEAKAQLQRLSEYPEFAKENFMDGLLRHL